MKAVTAAQMSEIDRRSIEEFGIPAAVLMGYAGKACADYILAEYTKGTVYVFSGTGNNGGDGCVIAFHLFNAGYHVRLFICGDEKKMSQTSRVYYDVCCASGIRTENINNAETLNACSINDCTLIVDALLGTGVRGEVNGFISDCISVINLSDVPVVSIDIPSGLVSDGAVNILSPVVHAHTTLTIGLPKINIVTYPGRIFAGNVQVLDIGFPYTLTNDSSLKAELIDMKLVRSVLCGTVPPDIHKGENGHALIIGGFDTMEGAALLAAGALFETGTGLATIATTPSAQNIIAAKIPECMTAVLPEIHATEDEIDSAVAELLSKHVYRGIVIGPGMSSSEYAYSVFCSVINHVHEYQIKSVLIDGDGLFHLVRFLKTAALSGSVEWIITPHFLEASRLLDVPVDVIASNRFFFAEELSRLTKSVVVLKGPASIAAYNGNARINTTGSPAMATAGSGDVLSGIIGALMLRHSGFDAASCGVFIHGSAGEAAAAECSSPIIKSGDIIHNIRRVSMPVYA